MCKVSVAEAARLISLFFTHSECLIRTFLARNGKVFSLLFSRSLLRFLVLLLLWRQRGAGPERPAQVFGVAVLAGRVDVDVLVLHRAGGGPAQRQAKLEVVRGAQQEQVLQRTSLAQHSHQQGLLHEGKNNQN